MNRVVATIIATLNHGIQDDHTSSSKGDGNGYDFDGLDVEKCFDQAIRKTAQKTWIGNIAGIYCTPIDQEKLSKPSGPNKKQRIVLRTSPMIGIESKNAGNKDQVGGIGTGDVVGHGVGDGVGS